MRSPVPRGENGLTFAHIRASLREIADLPSSSKNTGPWLIKKGSLFRKDRDNRIYTLLMFLFWFCLFSSWCCTILDSAINNQSHTHTYLCTSTFVRASVRIMYYPALLSSKYNNTHSLTLSLSHTLTYLNSISSETRHLDIWVAWEIRAHHIIGTAQDHHSWEGHFQPLRHRFHKKSDEHEKATELVTLPGSASWILLWRQTKASFWHSDGGLKKNHRDCSTKIHYQCLRNSGHQELHEFRLRGGFGLGA